MCNRVSMQNVWMVELAELRELCSGLVVLAPKDQLCMLLGISRLADARRDIGSAANILCD